MAEKIYPAGIRSFKKKDNQPDFVIGTVVITLNELVKFCKEKPELLSEYNGEKQLVLQHLSGNKGPYFVVDTYKPKEKEEESQLPF